MKAGVAAILLGLCGIIAIIDVAYGLPEYESAGAQFFWGGGNRRRRIHAPDRGCAEIDHRIGHSHYRVYVCDGKNGPCVFSSINRCPQSALFHQYSREVEVSIRQRGHLVRFYNQIGGACFVSLVDNCPCGKETAFAEGDECKSLKLPHDEVLYDPIGCNGKPKAEMMDQEDLVDAMLDLLNAE